MTVRKQLAVETVSFPPVEIVRQRAVALLADGELGIATDADTYANTKNKPAAVLIAIARPTFSIVLAIDACQYDALKIAELAGFVVTPRKTTRKRLLPS